MTDFSKIDYIQKSKAPFRLWDILIYITAIILTVTLTLTVFNKKGGGVMVINDGVSTVYTLSKDREIVIDGKLKVVINGGECYVTDSQCKNKTCMHMGRIKRVNQSITCAQNKVVIKVIGESDLAGVVG